MVLNENTPASERREDAPSGAGQRLDEPVEQHRHRGVEHDLRDQRNPGGVRRAVEERPVVGVAPRHVGRVERLAARQRQRASSWYWSMPCQPHGCGDQTKTKNSPSASDSADARHGRTRRVERPCSAVSPFIARVGRAAEPGAAGGEVAAALARWPRADPERVQPAAVSVNRKRTASSGQRCEVAPLVQLTAAWCRRRVTRHAGRLAERRDHAPVASSTSTRKLAAVELGVDEQMRR